MIVDANASQLARKLARKAKRNTELKLRLQGRKPLKELPSAATTQERSASREDSDRDLSLMQVRQFDPYLHGEHSGEYIMASARKGKLK